MPRILPLLAALALPASLFAADPDTVMVRGAKGEKRGLIEKETPDGITLKSGGTSTEIAAKDIESLLPLGSAIRLVKGAYLESPSVAFPKKADVDENFYTLSCRLLSDEARRAGGLLHIATHDPRLADRLATYIDDAGVPKAAYEYAMLYGIQRPLQQRLVAAGRPLRVLIAYGEYWFPWYMRRLAERPANMWFVGKNIFR